MFSHQERLPREAFSARPHRRFVSTHFLATLPQGRGYAIVISKKTLPKAVDRHRLKRRVAAAFTSLPTPLPTAIILYPKASAADLPAPELRSELTALLARIR